MRSILYAMSVLVGLVAAGGAVAQQPEPSLLGDPEKGAVVFKKCAPCHKVGPDARIGVGPVLNGIVGRQAGTYPGYNYSKANKESGVTWDVENLTVYLRAPREFIPKTKMPFAGLKKDEEIADVLAYLVQFGLDGETVGQ